MVSCSRLRMPPGHGKSWNLGRPFSRTGKSWKIAKVTENDDNVMEFLGRLPKVDLIILEGEKCPSVRTSVRPSTKSFLDLNEIWYIGRGR